MVELTIGIPLLNEEISVSKCLESILKSNLPDSFEIIVCDNGSVDKSVELVKKFKSGAIKLIVEKRRGKAFVINKILDEAKSDYVVFCDADILVKKDTIKKVWKKLESSDLDVVGCDFENICSNPFFKNYYRILPKVLTDELPENIYGMCFGVRKKTFVRMPSVLSSDFFISAYYYFGNRKAIRDENITAYYKKAGTVKDVLMKKTRNRIKYLQIREDFPGLEKFQYEPKVDYKKLYKNLGVETFCVFLLHSFFETIAFILGAIIFYGSFKKISYSWRKAKSTALID